MKALRDKSLLFEKIAGWWMQAVVVPAKALQYAHAAGCDERNGFLYTACLEWRHAAELFEPGSLAADYCWKKWERIMHLPRQLATPLGGTLSVIAPLNATSARPAAAGARSR